MAAALKCVSIIYFGSVVAPMGYQLAASVPGVDAGEWF